MSILILLSYPLLSHFCVMTGHPFWSVLYLLGILGLFFIRAIATRKDFLASIIAFFLIVGAGLILQGQSKFVIYLPPIMINLGLFLFFGRSLQGDRVPLITRYAEIIDGNLNQEIVRYTKRVTQIWTILFFVMLMESIVLALFASWEIWSIFTNFINYGFVILMFIAEYFYRQAVYPNLPKRSFFRFFSLIMEIRPSQLRV